MRIESERLVIYPVSDDEMRIIAENEKDAELKQAYSEMLEGCLKEPENRIWYALWLIELKEPVGTVAGDLCFKGLAADGTVEIGYGLKDGFCGKGYMTEAVKAVAKWALEQNCVKRVEAETAPENEASQRVLAACGFVPSGTVGEEGPRFVLKK
ncbi:MAG: GNAT family N-acetyltransferase [Clostridiales bacterium]|nr:GNAT family N-acetyltransferase [Clostridiales bacterium]